MAARAEVSAAARRQASLGRPLVARAIQICQYRLCRLLPSGQSISPSERRLAPGAPQRRFGEPAA